MPRGHKDFWPGTSVAMPAAGAGQIPWYMSEAKLVNFGETYDLISYVVPDTFELHVCSGVVSCGTPRTQRYDLRQTPAGTWVRPTSFADPDDEWSNEEKAYDGNILTGAYTVTTGHYLELFLSTPSRCDKVKVLAFETATRGGEVSPNPDIDIDIFYLGAWHNIFSGTIATNTWVEKDTGTAELIGKARIKRNVIDELYLYLCEFQFNTAEVTPQEGIWFDTHAIIPYTAEAPYIVEPKAKFVVKVYNDDDLNSNMSVALAGFLQPAVL